MGTHSIAVNVNGRRIAADVEPRLLLVYFLREQASLTGTHIGCDTSQCGACTVQVDGVTVKSCTVLAVQADGHSVTTIEGLGDASRLTPLQQAFHERHALQCGFCTPGMIFAAQALLDRVPNPTEAQIRHALHGNLCRCTGYQSHRRCGAVRGKAPKVVSPACRGARMNISVSQPARTGFIGQPVLRREDAR